MRRCGEVRRFLALVALAAVAACGGEEDVTTAGISDDGSVESDHALSINNIESVALGADPSHLLVTVSAPEGDGDCRAGVEVWANEDDAGVRLQASISVANRDVDPRYPQCAHADRVVELALEMPLATRFVAWTTSAGQYRKLQGSSLVECALPDCDPDTGLPPPPPRCDNNSLRESMDQADVPRRAGITVRACAEPWAVVDIDYGAASCPADDTGPNPCAGKQVDRSYWEIVDGRWKLITFSSASGCGQIAETRPAFDRSLCADLPATPGS